jgi:hypothetical protein
MCVFVNWDTIFLEESFNGQQVPSPRNPPAPLYIEYVPPESWLKLVSVITLVRFNANVGA